MNNIIPIKQAARTLDIKQEILVEQIAAGKICSDGENITIDVFEEIKRQKEKYISLKIYLKRHDSDLFESKYVKNRDKYLDFLEENNFFEIEHVHSFDILFSLPSENDWYIPIEEIPFLDYKSRVFFDDFGLTEYEKIERLLKKNRINTETINYIKEFIKIKSANPSNLYTPAFTDFVEEIIEIRNVYRLKNEDIFELKNSLKTETAKEYLISFLTYVSQITSCNYGKIVSQVREPNSVPAYPYVQLVFLAKMLFNKTYISEHKMLEKALENHLFAEMWMFLSSFYVCGWRKESVCEDWVYPCLSEDNIWGINLHTLEDDILEDRISEELYKKITEYIIKKIELSNSLPEKTANLNPSTLRVAITPDLQIHFGKLALIAEYHMVNNKEGYMLYHRSNTYCNWVNLKEFLGDEYVESFGRRNIQTRRLNKAYLQSIEANGENAGYSPLVAHVIASYARNHTNIDTTVSYLKDHGLTGESAEVVLYMMLQRGVFASSLYTALLTAYPEAFGKLSKSEQTAIMEKVPLSAYELEVLGRSNEATVVMTQRVKEGKAKAATELLNAMYEIGNGRGLGKDEGVYCKKRALGEICEHANFESCIANVCPYHVFTGEALPALVKVILEYEKKYRETGNEKYKIVLLKKIKPAFTEAINYVFAKMNEKEKNTIKGYLGEMINAGR